MEALTIFRLPGIAQLVSSVRIELISSSTRDTSVKSTKHELETDGQTLGPIDKNPPRPKFCCFLEKGQNDISMSKRRGCAPTFV